MKHHLSIPVVLHLHQQFILFSFIHFSHCSTFDISHYILICISLVTNKVVYLFNRHIYICISSLVKCLIIFSLSSMNHLFWSVFDLMPTFLWAMTWLVFFSSFLLKSKMLPLNEGLFTNIFWFILFVFTLEIFPSLTSCKFSLGSVNSFHKFMASYI